MPHELLHFGQVPQSRHDQLLNILAGIAGMQPRRLIERHVIYRPQRNPVQRQYAVGASQTVQTTQRATSREQLQKDMYYWQTVTELDEADLTEPTNGVDTKPHVQDGEAKGWTILFQDIPEAGQRPINMRWIQTSDVTAGDPHAFMKASQYKYVSEYIDEGYQFVHKNAIILLHRIMRLPTSVPSRDSPVEALPSYDELEPLDSSGAYILQVSIKIQDNYKPETREKATAEIMAFKNVMKGVVELGPAERLSLDTRVKAVAG
ncbi:mediator complex, subunit Med18 [Phyllosticta citribraziliensis]|uniref:Mediator of RNA polymerase II transcription subunit 18 n=1 Tax=Phyllosticta citribraziliensis TaxID=989973 RepID=A0ABR1LAW4_9PEZI